MALNLATVMCFFYSFIELGLGFAKVVGDGQIEGSIGGISQATELKKVWTISQVFESIAFGFPFSIIIFEIQDTLKSTPAENQTMKKASIIAISVPPSFISVVDALDLEVDMAEQFCQDVVVSRFVSEVIGRSLARAEAEEVAEAIIETKNQEISCLKDKLRYYETFRLVRFLRRLSQTYQREEDSQLQVCPFRLFPITAVYSCMNLQAEHKILSASGPLDMRLTMVPKMLYVMRNSWAPMAFCIIFQGSRIWRRWHRRINVNQKQFAIPFKVRDIVCGSRFCRLYRCMRRIFSDNGLAIHILVRHIAG
ncbi:hypothetical protein GIB67_033125 [Kingdonia uniflora]|uniref:Amino acid transporter transmembrane domain-containing protein n=1 Tax=Kingdonia uniflora TaxID=39325 RepID=A0A7J7MYN5_9MAGN|nr:hypothetical protein GIB67_033125 [Kingdonia uniflora]